MQWISEAAGLSLTRETLYERTLILREHVGASDPETALYDQGPYGSDKSASILDSIYWSEPLSQTLPVLTQGRREAANGNQAFLDSIPNSIPDPSASVSFLDASMCGQEAVSPSMAGYAVAQYLRSQGYHAVHVRPQYSVSLPDVRTELRSFKLGVLFKMMSSLVCSLVLLAPERMWFSSSASTACFARLAECGGRRSFEAGLTLLQALPRLELHGRRGLVLIVDELDVAIGPSTSLQVARFRVALEDMCARNDAGLLYTSTEPLRR